MKVNVDRTKCQGYASCNEAAPDLLKLDDFGFAYVDDDGQVPEGQESLAQQAAGVCPALAITIEQ
jgi:ferredoxin